MLTKIVYFDYAAIVITGTIIAIAHFRKMLKGKINQSFLTFACIILFTAIFGSFSLNYDNLGSGNISQKYLFHTLYLLCHNLSAFYYLFYLITLTDTWHIISGKKRFLCLLFVPIILVVVGLIVNFFTPILFYFDENDVYSRSDLFKWLYIIGFYYLTFGVIYILKNKNLFPAKMVYTVFSLYPITLITTILEMIFPQIIIELFGNAICLLVITTNIQRTEDTMDEATQLCNKNTYSFDCKKIFANKKNVAVIIVNITNYKTLRGIIGYGNKFKLSRVIAQSLEKINANLKLKALIYYLGKGQYRVIIEKKNFGKVDEAAKAIKEYCDTTLKAENLEINLIANVCVAYCPQDIPEMSGLVNFGYDLNEGKYYSKKVLYAADLYKQDYYNKVLDMNHIIERAISTNGFQMYYQPIYSVEEKRITSAEALLRLKDEKYGYISPELFIPAAEKSGVIHKIGTFVLEDVCRFIASDEFKQLGIDYVEVNLSVAQCMQDNLSSTVLSVLDKYGVAPEKINLEITETALAQSQDVFINNLNNLVQSGLNISLDDFGSGYSNLQRIAQIPFEIIKIDKSFTDNCNNPKVRVILENIIKMATSLNLKVVVEGIEDKEILETFENLHCDYIQGYIFSKPIPEKEFINYVNNFTGVEAI